MIRTIIVGCDLSAPSDLAIDRAIGIALLHGAKLVLAHAQADDAPIEDVNNAMLAHISQVSAAVRAVSADKLAAKLAEVQALGVTCEIELRLGPPGEVLAELAAELPAELIVVGTHGSTGISRFLLGSVAAETVRHAPCNVLVCRGPGTRTAFARPVVAMDFSPAASRALNHTVDLTLPNATIEVVHAWQLPAGSWGASFLGLQSHFPWNIVRDAVLSGVQAQVDKLKTQHTRLTRPFHVELVQGPPASVITAVAERGGHDLIVVGTHGHRGFRRLLLGSVADGVIRHAPCSVLVVHGEHAGDTANFPRANL
ncbi:MAG: universal stress protein [Deltaproteobacteria bacterium]|nr:universal stress protein [Deltaproteobacteria bacterium]